MADFCCGTGLYSAAAYFFDAKEVYALDIDPAALSACNSALSELDSANYHTELIDLCDETRMAKYRGIFDTVVMNPPFGTKENEGIDMKILKSAVMVSERRERV